MFSEESISRTNPFTAELLLGPLEFVTPLYIPSPLITSIRNLNCRQLLPLQMLTSSIPKDGQARPSKLNYLKIHYLPPRKLLPCNFYPIVPLRLAKQIEFLFCLIFLQIFEDIYHPLPTPLNLHQSSFSSSYVKIRKLPPFWPFHRLFPLQSGVPHKYVHVINNHGKFWQRSKYTIGNW